MIALGEIVRLQVQRSTLRLAAEAGAAHPQRYVPFSRFALRLGPADPSGGQVTEALRFLREGTRGFYVSYGGPGVLLHAGDRVVVQNATEV